MASKRTRLFTSAETLLLLEVEDDGFDSDKDPEYAPRGSDEGSDSETSFIEDRPVAAEISNGHSSSLPAENSVDTESIDLHTSTDQRPGVLGPESRKACNGDPNAQPTTTETVHGNSLETPTQRKKLTRKRVIQKETWKSTKRLKAAQIGQAYTTVRGKQRPARSVKTLKDCSKCKFKCSGFFSADERQFIHEIYWNQDQRGKDNFLVRNTEMTDKKRSKVKNRRNMSFAYYLTTPEKKVRVCKQFFLGTLDIAQSVIYRVHANKEKLTNSPLPPKKGKHTKKKTKEEVKSFVKSHIESFPAIESHYCRARTNKTYLDSTLNIKKMYELYLEKVREEKKEESFVVKESYYREIFNTEYNIAFFKPKSDRCDDCEKFKIAQKEGLMTPEMAREKENHVKEKDAMRANRNLDRGNKEKLVITFDLENVITCPRANISSFFYHSKLNMYNLTAHASSNKKGYCAVWIETTAGRSGNDLASAMTAILKSIVADFPHVTELTTWSDSCVPQNRNSIMSMAMLKFLSDHPHVTKITMKYSSPGHGAVQEVDNLHSQIERAMDIAEFYSPISFIRILLKVNRHNPYKVLQMRSEHFFDFQGISSQLQFKKVPFTKVKMLEFNSQSTVIKFRDSFQNEIFQEVDIAPKTSDRRLMNAPVYKPPTPKVLEQVIKSLPQNKITSLKAMLKFMPLLERQFYSSIL